MADTGSSENPQGKSPHNNPEFRGPFPVKRGEARPIIDPIPNYNPDAQQKSAPATREELFRTAAIECAQLEGEVSKLLREKFPENGTWTLVTGKHMYVSKENDFYNFVDNEEDMGSREGRIWIGFMDGITDEFKQGLRTQKGLLLQADIDEDAVVKEGETRLRDSYLFFTEEGEFCRMDSMQTGPQFIDSIDRYVPAEMTEDNFEIAKLALRLLKKRLVDPAWDQKQDSEPEV